MMYSLGTSCVSILNVLFAEVSVKIIYVLVASVKDVDK